MTGAATLAMGHDLALLLPQLLVLVTAVGALVAEMLQRPRAALVITVAGLLVAAMLAATRLDQQVTVFL
ncbi:MAG TPA: hypothetical protein VFU72_04805, partial [Nitrolancea sp.]|nr:hypothetical protein [Nitrolancea sp.]